MNGPRNKGEETPEGRLAAIVLELLHDFEKKHATRGGRDAVDYADVKLALQPYVAREILNARLEEVRHARGHQRERQLFQELAEAESVIASRGAGAKSV